MTPNEFHEFLKSEPDSYELLDGRPVRVPEYKQDGRRLGALLRAAEIAMDDSSAIRKWLDTPLSKLHGRTPFQCVRSWSSVEEALSCLDDLGQSRTVRGDTTKPLRDRVRHLADVEAARQRVLLASIPP